MGGLKKFKSRGSEQVSSGKTAYSILNFSGQDLLVVPKEQIERLKEKWVRK